MGLAAALALAEIGLRLSGFAPGRVNAGYLRFGYTTGIPLHDEDGILKEGVPAQMRLFEPDPDLFWRPIPRTPFTNAQGFRNRRDLGALKDPGTRRVLFLGDSCLFLGDPVYPELVERALVQHSGGHRVECINASVPGYSSHQGVVRLRQLAALQPDIVAVSFGWNDHWLAQGGLTDRRQSRLNRGSRLAATLSAARARFFGPPRKRVPLVEFRSNLEAILKITQAMGVRAVFITAPSGFRTGELPAWTYRFFHEFYRMTPSQVRAIPEVHAAYAEAVRGVANKGGAILVDAERHFREENLSIPAHFRGDLIHLRNPGHERMAQLATEAIQRAIAADSSPPSWPRAPDL